MPYTDVKLNSNLKNVKCPLCHKPEVYYNDLVCSNCNNNELELIRNSCIENDSINDVARDKINGIFSSCQNVKDLKAIEISPKQPNETPQPSINAMKSLALQLIKLDILNTNLKIKNIDKTQELLDSRISELTDTILTLQNKLETKQEKLESNCSKLFKNFEETDDGLKSKIQEYKFEKINQIKKQSIQLQYNNYKVLKEMVFTTNNSKSANFNYITKLKASSASNLLFHNRSILNINEFFSFNNKLPQINEFLENLIKLQVHLQVIFNIDTLRLPYLEELIGYLPDSKFYDMIQEKENFMINGGKLSSDEIEEVEEEKNSSVQEMNVGEERVIKLGNTIKLPLSSKTINSQLRRASLNKDESASSSAKQREDEKTTHKKASSPIRSTLSGKKMIILPHKILTKPFTKLTAKEYLKFLLIIVKILINFKTFFYFTIDSIPNLHKQSSMLSNTMNQFRNNLEEKDILSNFEKILEKVASMDRYFTYKLNGVQNSKSSDGNYDMSTSNLLSSNAGTFKSFNTHFTSMSNANYDLHSPISAPNSTHSLNSSAVVTQTDGKLRQFYSKHFKNSIHKPSDHEIYGNFSESKDEQLEYSNDADDDLMNESELKTIMQNVYKLMATGTSRQRNSKINNKSKNLDFNAINMIAQSKVQLDEWDVVSKMY
ncbi:uncharacterized protein AC631_03661 [Debaryomyces fabryi]|uniref:Uncharacterized protein n=1 Tax=Debaryomyces fabryi TaxID=58627 RepID=A0A0V1PWK9_9ASCO|nr:uncharacterized protein AC631_03661 [Debaryomyces fabryi]KSA00566.1 hypothetical protein AC631_03661 [Debaryomyces fabryi]CUM45893.1 unnamed protein product [Debaryomyces fabryi]